MNSINSKETIQSIEGFSSTELEMTSRVISATVDKIKDALQTSGTDEQKNTASLVRLLESTLAKQQSLLANIAKPVSSDLDSGRGADETDSGYIGRLQQSLKDLSETHTKTLKDLDYQTRAHHACHQEVHRLRQVIKSLLSSSESTGAVASTESFLKLRGNVLAKLDRYLVCINQAHVHLEESSKSLHDVDPSLSSSISRLGDQIKILRTCISLDRQIVAGSKLKDLQGLDTKESLSEEVDKQFQLYDRILDLELQVEFLKKTPSSSEPDSSCSLDKASDSFKCLDLYPCEIIDTVRLDVQHADLPVDASVMSDKAVLPLTKYSENAVNIASLSVVNEKEALISEEPQFERFYEEPVAVLDNIKTVCKDDCYSDEDVESINLPDDVFGDESLANNDIQASVDAVNIGSNQMLGSQDVWQPDLAAESFDNVVPYNTERSYINEDVDYDEIDLHDELEEHEEIDRDMSITPTPFSIRSSAPKVFDRDSPSNFVDSSKNFEDENAGDDQGDRTDKVEPALLSEAPKKLSKSWADIVTRNPQASSSVTKSKEIPQEVQVSDSKPNNIDIPKTAAKSWASVVSSRPSEFQQQDSAKEAEKPEDIPTNFANKTLSVDNVEVSETSLFQAPKATTKRWADIAASKPQEKELPSPKKEEKSNLDSLEHVEKADVTGIPKKITKSWADMAASKPKPAEQKLEIQKADAVFVDKADAIEDVPVTLSQAPVSLGKSWAGIVASKSEFKANLVNKEDLKKSDVHKKLTNDGSITKVPVELKKSWAQIAATKHNDGASTSPVQKNSDIALFSAPKSTDDFKYQPALKTASSVESTEATREPEFDDEENEKSNNALQSVPNQLQRSWAQIAAPKPKLTESNIENVGFRSQEIESNHDSESNESVEDSPEVSTTSNLSNVSNQLARSWAQIVALKPQKHVVLPASNDINEDSAESEFDDESIDDAYEKYDGSNISSSPNQMTRSWAEIAAPKPTLTKKDDPRKELDKNVGDNREVSHDSSKESTLSNAPKQLTKSWAQIAAVKPRAFVNVSAKAEINEKVESEFDDESIDDGAYEQPEESLLADLPKQLTKSWAQIASTKPKAVESKIDNAVRIEGNLEKDADSQEPDEDSADAFAQTSLSNAPKQLTKSWAQIAATKPQTSAKNVEASKQSTTVNDEKANSPSSEAPIMSNAPNKLTKSWANIAAAKRDDDFSATESKKAAKDSFESEFNEANASVQPAKTWAQIAAVSPQSIIEKAPISLESEFDDQTDSGEQDSAEATAEHDQEADRMTLEEQLPTKTWSSIVKQSHPEADKECKGKFVELTENETFANIDYDDDIQATIISEIIPFSSDYKEMHIAKNLNDDTSESQDRIDPEKYVYDSISSNESPREIKIAPSKEDKSQDDIETRRKFSFLWAEEPVYSEETPESSIEKVENTCISVSDNAAVDRAERQDSIRSIMTDPFADKYQIISRRASAIPFQAISDEVKLSIAQDTIGEVEESVEVIEDSCKDILANFEDGSAVDSAQKEIECIIALETQEIDSMTDELGDEVIIASQNNDVLEPQLAETVEFSHGEPIFTISQEKRPSEALSVLTSAAAPEIAEIIEKEKLELNSESSKKSVGKKVIDEIEETESIDIFKSGLVDISAQRNEIVDDEGNPEPVRGRPSITIHSNDDSNVVDFSVESQSDEKQEENDIIKASSPFMQNASSPLGTISPPGSRSHSISFGRKFSQPEDGFFSSIAKTSKTIIAKKADDVPDVTVIGKETTEFEAVGQVDTVAVETDSSGVTENLSLKNDVFNSPMTVESSEESIGRPRSPNSFRSQSVAHQLSVSSLPEIASEPSDSAKFAHEEQGVIVERVETIPNSQCEKEVSDSAKDFYNTDAIRDDAQSESRQTEEVAHGLTPLKLGKPNSIKTWIAPFAKAFKDLVVRAAPVKVEDEDIAAPESNTDENQAESENSNAQTVTDEIVAQKLSEVYVETPEVRLIKIKEIPYASSEDTLFELEDSFGDTDVTSDASLNVLDQLLSNSIDASASQDLALKSQDFDGEQDFFEEVDIASMIETLKHDRSKSEDVLAIVQKDEPSTKPSMTPDQLNEVLNNPYIPDHIKESIRALNSENTALQQLVKLKDAENDQLKNELSDAQVMVKEIAVKTQQLKQAFTDVYEENSQLKSTNADLEEHIKQLAGLVPELNNLVEVQGETAETDVVNVIGRLKKIWNDLMVLYMEKSDMPDIKPLKELDYILDQIDISVLTVSKSLHSAQGKPETETSSEFLVSKELI